MDGEVPFVNPLKSLPTLSIYSPIIVDAENGSIIINATCCGCGVVDGVIEGVGVIVEVILGVGVDEGTIKLEDTVGVTVGIGVVDGVAVGVGVLVFVGVGVIQLKDCCYSHPFASIILTIIVGLFVKPDGMFKIKDGGTVVLPE